jgi:copper chaperone CopZ
MEELRVQVKGMACGSCAARVETALKSMPGVSSVKVDLKAAEARIFIDPTVTDVEKVRRKIKQTGYQAGECAHTACEQATKGGLFSRLRGK